MAHPIIGVWAAEGQHDGTFRVDRFTFAFHADGTLSLSAFDLSHNGVWQATGPGSAALLAARPAPLDQGVSGWFSLKGSVVVSPDGMSCAIRATLKRPRPDGSANLDDITLSGRRLLIDSEL